MDRISRFFSVSDGLTEAANDHFAKLYKEGHRVASLAHPPAEPPDAERRQSYRSRLDELRSVRPEPEH